MGTAPTACFREATHINQNDMETVPLQSQQSHELTHTYNNLDGPFLLKNGDTIPILPLGEPVPMLLTLKGPLKYQADSCLDY